MKAIICGLWKEQSRVNVLIRSANPVAEHERQRATELLSHKVLICEGFSLSLAVTEYKYSFVL